MKSNSRITEVCNLLVYSICSRNKQAYWLAQLEYNRDRARLKFRTHFKETHVFHY
jgi:hypothetical protein